jgi:hypothetical protein
MRAFNPHTPASACYLPVSKGPTTKNLVGNSRSGPANDAPISYHILRSGFFIHGKKTAPFAVCYLPGVERGDA